MKIKYIDFIPLRVYRDVFYISINKLCSNLKMPTPIIKSRNILFLFCIVLFVSCSDYENYTTMVEMRDGIKLSTRILFPEVKQEKHPVVFIRTPYNKERRINEYQYILDNGFCLVVQDVRGRFESEGEFEPYINESEDGYDAIQWIAEQKWCDGNIGMIGASYNGSVQYCAAIEQPPNLKTIIPSVGSADLFYDGEYVNGVFLSSRLIWCGIVEAIAPDEEVLGKDWGKILNHSPISELDSIALGKKLDYYQDWIKHDSKDAYWKQTTHREKLKRIRIPVFTQTGWFDTHLRSSTLVYNELTAAGNKNVKMIIGPWGHTDRESNFYNKEFMGEAADDIDLQKQYIRWLDHWLKGENNGIMEEPLVNLYVVNANKWYSSHTYPFPFTTDTKLYLSSENTPNLITQSGAMKPTYDSVNGQMDTYTYTPSKAPVYSMEMLERGGYDKLKKMLEKRDDYLFYQTELNEETTIIGSITARIYATTTAPDTDWFLILVALDENNVFEELISIGVQRARFRNSLEKPELIGKGVIQYDFEMDHYGIQIKEGQKLGLIVTSSFGYPFLSKNLNTGNNNQTNTEFLEAEQTIYHSDEYRSYISVPIITR